MLNPPPPLRVLRVIWMVPNQKRREGQVCISCQCQCFSLDLLCNVKRLLAWLKLINCITKYRCLQYVYEKLMLMFKNIVDQRIFFIKESGAIMKCQRGIKVLLRKRKCSSTFNLTFLLLLSYSAYQEFGQPGWNLLPVVVLSSSKFSLLAQLPHNMKLASIVVKSDSKIIIYCCRIRCSHHTFVPFWPITKRFFLFRIIAIFLLSSHCSEHRWQRPSLRILLCILRKKMSLFIV